MSFLNPDFRFDSRLPQLYQTNSPYPHIILDDFFNPTILEKILVELPDLSNHTDVDYLHDPAQEKYQTKGEIEG